jgi:hypothetical protein
MKHDNTISSVPASAKRELKRAIAKWVSSLSPGAASTKVLAFGAISYTPAEILQEVQRETAFGEEFIAGLHALSEEMAIEHPETRIADLISSL